MAKYIHQSNRWPDFKWKKEDVRPELNLVRNKQIRLRAKMEMLGFSQRNESILQTLTLDVIKTSEIEGEILNVGQVRSSIARKLGIDIAGLIPSNRNVDGVVEMMLDATQNYTKRLTVNRLFEWHNSLFPSGRSGLYKIRVGGWRTNENGPMQVVSGAIGREHVHYEAPDADRIKKEMALFLKWFNESDTIDPLLKSAIAHLWFITIHPFDDGNGRIARTIADMQLAKSENDKNRFYSMSAQIQSKRKTYYEILEKTQKGNLDITEWLLWFLKNLERAIDVTDNVLQQVVNKSKFWDNHIDLPVNARQRLLINKLFDGFEGKLTSSKWAVICKCSPDTALRDIQDLINKNILEKESSGGRSTGYILKNIQL